MWEITLLYFGYNNPRRGFSVNGHEIVVLIDGQRSCVLQGAAAVEAQADIIALTDHLLGNAHFDRMADLVAASAHHQHDHHVYNAVFDEHFRLAV